MRIAVVIAALTIVTGCAKSASDVVAVPVGQAAFTGKTCDELRVDRAEQTARVTALSKAQDSARTSDFFSVALTFVPVSAFTGDREEELGLAKGRLDGLEQEMSAKKCTV